MGVFIECIHEPVDRPSQPVPLVEELDLEPSEEALHRQVARRAALLRHGADGAVSLVPLDPTGSTAMAAPIAVTGGMLSFLQLGRRGARHGVQKLGVGRGRPRPLRAHVDEAIGDGARAPPARRNRDLVDIGGPEAIGACAWKSCLAMFLGVPSISPS